MPDEQDDDDLAAMGAKKTSPRMLLAFAIAGALVAIVLALASYYAVGRDRASERSEVNATHR
jgi:hypothetical protein